MTVKISLWVITLLISLTSFGAGATPSAKPLVLIYRGPGACIGCPETIADVVTQMGFQVRFVKPGDLTTKNFSRALLYVQPGGSDNIDETLNALSSSEIENLRKFVAGGGRYLGLCAGAYLAGTWSDTDKKTRAFGLIPSIVDQEGDDNKAHSELIQWKNHDYWVYFQAGPQFNFSEIPRAERWATYKTTGHGAALIAPFGRGFVGLIGPHVEAESDWFSEDHIPIIDELHGNLAQDFVRALLSKP